MSCDHRHENQTHKWEPNCAERDARAAHSADSVSWLLVAMASGSPMGMREAFEEFDINGDGKISRDDFRQITLRPDSGSGFTVAEADECFDLMDADGNGFVDYHEFVAEFRAAAGPFPQRLCCAKHQQAGPMGACSSTPSDDALVAARAEIAALTKAKEDAESAAAGASAEIARLRERIDRLGEEIDRLRLAAAAGEAEEAKAAPRGEASGAAAAEIARLKEELEKARAQASGAPAPAAAAAEPAAPDPEAEAARAEAEAEEKAGTCTFSFISAEAILNTEETTLPNFNALLESNVGREGLVVRRTLTAGEAYRAAYAGETLAVSHRWEHPDAPDPTGVQLDALKRHLKAHPEVCARHRSRPLPSLSPAGPASARTPRRRRRPPLPLAALPGEIHMVRFLVHAAGRAHARRARALQVDAAERQPALPRLLGASADGHLVHEPLLDAGAASSARLPPPRPRASPLNRLRHPHHLKPAPAALTLPALSANSSRRGPACRRAARAGCTRRRSCGGAARSSACTTRRRAPRTSS